jgi:predicted GH43/DUF377 family glycosyl hydrolase
LRKPLLILAALVFIAILLPTAAYGAGQQWTEYSGNPVLGPSLGEWDGDYTLSPRILLLNASYRMWFDGGSRNGTNGIGYATSADGISWSKNANPVLSSGPPGAWDSSSVALGSVLWNGTIFFMWYRGTSPTTYQTGAVGLATSLDGVSWLKFSGNPVLTGTTVDQEYIANPYVLKPTLSYDMWYTARSTSYPKSSPYTEILLATSADGIDWVKWPHAVFSPSTDSMRWDSGAVYSPAVYWNATTFWMWYSGLGQSFLNPQIGIATSPDGATWTRSADNPILSPGPADSWNSAGVERTDLTIGSHGLMLYFDGLGPNAPGRIGFAYAPSGFTIPEFAFPTAVLVVEVAGCVAILALRRPRNRWGILR